MNTQYMQFNISTKNYKA